MPSFKSLLIASALLGAGFAQAQDLKSIESNRVLLPNGWALTPIGKSLPLGDLPLNIVVSKSNRLAAVTNNGQSTQTIQLLDAVNDKELDKVVISRAWGGLAFSDDEKSLFVSGGDNNWIQRYAIRSNKLVPADTIKLGPLYTKKNNSAISPTGLALDDKKGVLYAVTKQDNSLYVLDIKKKSVLQKIPLGAEAYTCLLNADKSRLYVTLWGGDKVAIFDTKTNALLKTIAVGDNPNELCLSSNGKYLFVANANDNTVSLIDLKKDQVIETLNTAVYPTQLSGSTSNSLALSKDNKVLYVANADNNCLSVFDVSAPGYSRSRGFVPTGWYPSVVRMIGSKLYVANAKGFTSKANPQGPNPTDKKEPVILHEGIPTKPARVQYIGGGLLMGTLSVIPTPTEKQLAVYSQAVYRNTPYHKEQESSAKVEAGNPVPATLGGASPIKHVFYILKENRTYDQVLSDIPSGNGDTSILLFGRRITPNLHAIAENFVLLDNFYVDGEVSADGHNWSMGAYATDFMEKNWPTSYGGRGKGATGDIHRNKLYIWDQAKKANVSYRSYGEFVGNNKPALSALKGHFCASYPLGGLKERDTSRYSAWAHDFDSLLAINALPGLSTLHFPSDHTEGTTAGRPTPFAHVADNDLAVGLFIEHLSKSPVWESSVVFVIEDDAQNGPDHVDAHRTTAYVAGGYVKRNYVDHTPYSTSSMLRTMELILGLAPMTQYDAAAMPMWRCFSKTPDLRPFNSLPANVDLDEINPDGKLSAMAKGLNFKDVDRIPDELMNTMIWKAVKGESAPVPTPVRAAFLKAEKGGDDDDD